MLIVGERINSTRQRIQEGIKARSATFVIKEASTQRSAGAAYIDVNCAVTSGDELQDMGWVLGVIQSEMPDIGICIDSPNYRAIEKALAVYTGTGPLIINSITGEDLRIRQIVPLAVKYNTKLIALTMDDKGMPDTAGARFDIARTIFERVKREGFNIENLYFDALIRPIATEPAQAKEFLASIPMIKSLGPVKTICGLSNVSFGLPNRGTVNAAFLSMAIHAGLDAAILDPTDTHIYAAIAASRALLAQDEYCAEYIRAFREGRLT